MIIRYSNKKIPYRFHKSENSYVVHCNNDWVNQPNAMSYLHTIQQTRGLKECIKYDHILYKCIYTTDWCTIYHTQTSEMRQSYYVTADYHACARARMRTHTPHDKSAFLHTVNTHNITSSGTTKYSYSKWELWIFKWEKQKVIYPSASLPFPEVQPTHMETLAVMCQTPLLLQFQFSACSPSFLSNTSYRQKRTFLHPLQPSKDAVWCV